MPKLLILLAALACSACNAADRPVTAQDVASVDRIAAPLANVCNAESGGGSCQSCSVSCPSDRIAYCRAGRGDYGPFGNQPRCNQEPVCACLKPD